LFLDLSPAKTRSRNNRREDSLTIEDDQRHRFPFDAAELEHAHGVPEIRELRRGDEITLATALHATGGTPPRARLQMFGWTV
jgi:hypothetical protein